MTNSYTIFNKNNISFHYYHNSNICHYISIPQYNNIYSITLFRETSSKILYSGISQNTIKKYNLKFSNKINRKYYTTRKFAFKKLFITLYYYNI